MESDGECVEEGLRGNLPGWCAMSGCFRTERRSRWLVSEAENMPHRGRPALERPGSGALLHRALLTDALARERGTSGIGITIDFRVRERARR
jgi:hypothetical protein